MTNLDLNWVCIGIILLMVQIMIVCIVYSRGFALYKRYKKQYREAKTRMNDWGEIYNHKAVRRNLRTQAAR